MSTETKKPRKAPVKKEPTATAEKNTRTAPKAKAVKAAVSGITAVPSNVKQWPSYEEIAMLAHRYYEERGRRHGFHEEDWFRAEQELLEAS